jgi:hypothetical protein
VDTIDEQERLRLDYSETTGLLRDLADIRFKLVALLPTVSGAAVALLSRHPGPGQLLGVGILGLCATTGVVVYELRNSEVYDYALGRAQELEGALGIRSAFDRDRPGGLFSERPDRERRLLGIRVVHDRGLALVYAAAVGGWSYLLAWGALHALGLSHSQRSGGAIAVLAALLLLVELSRGGTRAGAAAARPDAGAGERRSTATT